MCVNALSGTAPPFTAVTATGFAEPDVDVAEGPAGPTVGEALVVKTPEELAEEFGVVAAIHWEALFIWLKGEKIRTRPKKPERFVTVSPPAKLAA